MKMLDDKGDDTFHGTRESYSYLSDVEWSAVERMSSTVGEEAVWSLLSSRLGTNSIPLSPSSCSENLTRRELK